MNILEGGDERYVILPIQYPEIWEMYKRHEASFWTAQEIDLAVDKVDWSNLNDDERFFIKMVLAFFSQADGIVNENLAMRFYCDVKIPEARAFYSFQIAMETIHSETYSLLIHTLISDKGEQSKLFNATKNFLSIKNKAEWCKRWIGSSNSFSERLIGFACVEGIFFSGSFCAIYWLKKRGVMPGLTFSNELIARDEGLHTDFACLLYKTLPHSLSYEVVSTIVKEAVELEGDFITEALPCSLIGMNCNQMKQYIKFVADHLVESLGYSKIYNVDNPFDFMELISMQGKTNFFERRVGEYQLSGVLASVNDESNKEIKFDEEF